MPSSTDCIQRQNKLEEFGVKYICTAEEGGISLQQDTVTVGVNLNGRSICTIVLLILIASYNHHVVHDFVFGGTYCGINTVSLAVVSRECTLYSRSI